MLCAALCGIRIRIVVTHEPCRFMADVCLKFAAAAWSAGRGLRGRHGAGVADRAPAGPGVDVPPPAVAPGGRRGSRRLLASHGE